MGASDGAGQSASKGAVLGIAYTGDVMANVRGGLRRDAIVLDNLDVTLAVNGGPLLGWSGTTAFVYGLANQGGNPSAFIGDVQVANNIEAPLSWRMYEAWAQQVFGKGRFSVLAGLYDVNSEFDVMQTAMLFLNSSHGIGAEFAASGRNGPSIFPVTSLGMRGRWLPAYPWYVQAGMFDGVPGDPDDPGGTQILFEEGDGLLFTAEAGRARSLSRSVGHRYQRVSRTADPEYRSKVALGGWIYTSRFDTWSAAPPTERERSWGLYVLGDAHLYPEPGGEATEGLAGFLHVGLANGSVNRFVSYTGAGLVYTGPFEGRPADRIGVGVAVAHNGSAYMEAQRRQGQGVDRSEINIEFTYGAILTSWCTIKGDVQYIVHPNTDPSVSNALVIGGRILIAP